MSLQPPPFADFDFAFDPSVSNLFPDPPQLPPSADLFSPSESADLFGFLDNFTWDMDTIDPQLRPAPTPSSHISTKPYSNPHNPPEPPTTSNTARPAARASTTRSRNRSQSSAKPIRPAPDNGDKPPNGQVQSAESQRPKQLLSSPQKRLNHIMSEQKRRNAIRDGYAQLITLLAPAGSEPGIGMPTRGRPKGSGGNNNGQSKGKSGVLFRAVEYIKWLEDGVEALREEVARVESITSNPIPQYS